MKLLDLNDESRNNKVITGLNRIFIAISIQIAIFIFIFIFDIDTFEFTLDHLINRVGGSAFIAVATYAYSKFLVIPLIRWSIKGFIDGE
ncbi:hypothetical protein [Methylophaga nitratireducenticrescens]|uniref:hypothetical protein n=1 Tax=Methylophaga nitratireducenticrescens TaxID=754476 RepID=UPI000CDBBAFA|nr:hypothetical protein [Methylophaga nitratireducenticrescens]AUZ84759.1 hypothetical protein CDW43_09300 [Methylophaga nitratireducenticrescens]